MKLFSKPRCIFAGLALLALAAITVGYFLRCEDPIANRARASAELMEMDLFYARSPFILLVDKEFKERGSVDSFTLFSEDPPLSFSVNAPLLSDYLGEGTKYVTIDISRDTSITYYYLPDESGNSDDPVTAVTVTKEESGFTDFNADGSYDIRNIPDVRNGQRVVQVWFDNEWRDAVVHEGLFKKKLSDGVSVQFDRNLGRWVAQPAEQHSGP